MVSKEHITRPSSPCQAAKDTRKHAETFVDIDEAFPDDAQQPVKTQIETKLPPATKSRPDKAYKETLMVAAARLSKATANLSDVLKSLAENDD